MLCYYTITAITFSILNQNSSLMHQQRADYPLSLPEFRLRIEKVIAIIVNDKGQGECK